MSIIKPGEIRVDVLVISKVKQQQGLKGGGEGELEKNKKTFKSFLEKKQEENKRNNPKTNPERRNVLDFLKTYCNRLEKDLFPCSEQEPYRGTGIPCFGFAPLPCGWWVFTSRASSQGWYRFPCTMLLEGQRIPIAKNTLFLPVF